MNENNYLVIMAGGVGSRFWPYSRESHPKQFKDILGTGKTLLQQTVYRFKKIVPVKNIFIVTNKIYNNLVQEQLPELKDYQILLEPRMRNTAPCIVYACYKIRMKNPDARIVVTPSDHTISDDQEFKNIIKRSLEEVSGKDMFVTIGITPSRPETGYGYIQFIKSRGLFKPVKTFTEKPALDLAIKFIESGEFVWNAGIFIWNVAAIRKAVKKYLPDMDEVFEEAKSAFYSKSEQDAIDKAYSHCQNISIDYGIMEKAKNVYVALGSFGWSDLGSWNSLYDISEKDEEENVVDANALIYDSTKCIVKGPEDKLIVIEGLEGYLVAEYENAIIICKKDHEKQFRKYIKDVKNKKGQEYL